MNPHPLATHIFLKDLRRYWPLALAVAVLIVINLLGPLWDLKVIIGRKEYYDAINAFGVWPLIFILIVAVMQEDLTVGDRAFWRTRPIGPRPLLLGKLLFIATVLVPPALGVNLWLAAELDTPWRVALGIGLETTGLLLLIALLMALIAAVTRSLLHASMAALGVMLAVLLIAAIPGVRESANSNQHAFTLPWDTDIRYPGSRIAMAGLFLSLMAIGLLVHQFITRRSGRTISLLLIGTPVALFAAGQWTFNFIAPPPAALFPDKPLTKTEDIAIEVDPPVRISGDTWTWNPNGKPRKEKIVQAYVSLRGLPPGRLFELSSIGASFRLPEGRQVNLSRVSQHDALGFAYGFALSRRQQESAICRALGLEVGLTQEIGNAARIFGLPDSVLAELAGKSGQLTATFSLGEGAFREELRLPARAGGKWKNAGEMWRIDKITESRPPGTEGIRIDLRQMRATSMLVPDPRTMTEQGIIIIGQRQKIFVLLNRQRGEYAIATSFARLADGVVAATKYELFFTEPHRAGVAIPGAKIDRAWHADAELIILQMEALGTTEKVVVLENFLMPTPSVPTEPLFR